MKAVFYTGDKSFELREIARPDPAAGEVEIAVAYNGICGTDLHAYHGAMDARIGHNRVLGHEMSGRVARLGAGVTGLAVGQPVVIRPLKPCGDCPACNAGLSHICHKLKFLGLDTDGALQDYWSVPAYAVHPLPETVPLDHAALAEPVAVAAHDVRRSRLQAGEFALVIGGGPIGLLIAMVARHAGARVLISEVNPLRIGIAQEMGFDVVNPREANVIDTVNAATGQKGADVVFEVSGTVAGVELMTDVAASRGRICMVAIHTTRPQVDLFRFFWRELELIGARVYEAEDFDTAIDLIATGVIDAGRMITDVQDLSQVGAAFAALDGNAQAMKSLIRISG
ncbi:zinc-dependent alcohol dehydrogenase [Ketogulonicigenium vulgare]|uniref:zinc-dependent alcohol dehydrogenase n=1 Tax=Ketogulonicigenium vulgare TaxID=92945 RepID=UPI0023583B2E|nr:alcohol dehydrogenase catalytic domain-containing protein [Ketogulonicigenium vulgare]